jgi:hypothetical protein
MPVALAREQMETKNWWLAMVLELISNHLKRDGFHDA